MNLNIIVTAVGTTVTDAMRARVQAGLKKALGQGHTDQFVDARVTVKYEPLRKPDKRHTAQVDVKLKGRPRFVVSDTGNDLHFSIDAAMDKLSSAIEPRKDYQRGFKPSLYGFPESGKVKGRTASV